MSRPDESEDEGGFFSNWSKRKLAAKRPAAPSLDVDNDPEIEAEPEIVPAEVEQEYIDEEAVAALPPLEDIIEGSDIKPFLAKGVPAKLKNAAMRRLWMVTPGVRDYSDPAVDYAWDWNAPGGVPGGGGTLSEAGVAKMVKDLIGGRRDPPPEDGDVAGPVEKEQAASETVQPPEVSAEEMAQEDVPPSPVRRSGQESLQEASTHPKTTSGEAIRKHEMSANTLPPPRRHGGAVPD